MHRIGLPWNVGLITPIFSSSKRTGDAGSFISVVLITVCADQFTRLYCSFHSPRYIGLYLRRRAPLWDWTLLDRPLRYVLEGARTEYLGQQRGLLGFNSLNSLGLGLELDSSKYDIFITRTRLVARYMFSNSTSGYSIGLAMSF